MRVSRRALLAGGLSLAFAGAPKRAATQTLSGPTSLTIRTFPIRSFSLQDAEASRFGALTFRGGFEMSANHGAFGGFSGLSMAADGRSLVAVTDNGAWLTARLLYEGTRPTGLAQAQLAPILDANGRALKSTRAFDTECLCIHEGTAYIGIERVNQILRFDFARSGIAARGRPIPIPREIAILPHNRGIEAIGVASEGSAFPGALVAMAERSHRGPSEPTTGFILTGPGRGTFRYNRSEDFDITDLVFLPGGDMLVLERRFAMLRGVAMRIRRIAGRDIRPGATLDGPILIAADMGYQIDNMEALGFHRASDGAGVLTLVSDDNFSVLQRSILLQFALDR